MDIAHLRPAAPRAPARRARPAPRPEWTRPAIDPAERLWRPFPAQVADVLCAQLSGRGIAPHVHDDVQIVLPLAPVRVVDGLGRPAVAGAGSFVVRNPSDLHALEPDGAGPLAAGALLVAPALLADVWSEVSDIHRAGPPYFPRVVVDDAALAAELHVVFASMRGPVAALESAARLRAALARLVARHAELPNDAPGHMPRRVDGVARVREHLRAHVDAPLSLDDLARVAGLSRFYLLRAFNARFGVSPHAYQAQLRLARARRLLAQGITPSHAAYAAGFADQSHLTRRLKEATGLTPAAYARQLASAPPAAIRPHGEAPLAATAA